MKMKKLFALLLCAALLCPAMGLAEEDEDDDVQLAGSSYEHVRDAEDKLPEGVSPLPIDFSAGMPAQEDGFVEGGEWAYEYEDPSIHVTVYAGREAKCDYWVATIKIADASQLRTESAGGFDSTSAIKGQAMARRTNAILAIDGDYFCYSGNGGNGYIIRQGEVYNNKLVGNRDVLAIDSNGDFHVFYLPTDASEISLGMTDAQWRNVFYFGPVLVDNGEMVENVYGPNMAYDEPRQRMAICQVGPLEYKCVCCASRARGSAGMTLQQFADLVARQNVRIAYNLDGGDSTMMMFNGTKINDVRSTSVREINDIIYFASAYTKKEAAAE